MKHLPVFTLPRRFVLPGCESTLHLAREGSFRRLDEAYSSGREVFLATSDHHGSLDPIGVVARIVTFGRIPAPRGIEGTEDRTLLRGLYRARIPAGLRANLRDADVEPHPESPGEAPEGSERTRLEIAVENVRALHRSSSLRAQEIDALRDPIARLYRLAIEEHTRTEARQALLEAEGVRRKSALLAAAFEDEFDVLALEKRILGLE